MRFARTAHVFALALAACAVTACSQSEAAKPVEAPKLTAPAKAAEPATTTTAHADGDAQHDADKAMPGMHSEAEEKAEKVASADREQKDADGVVRRGKKLDAPATAKPLTVSEAVAKAKDLDGKPVFIRGTVASACQPMGCWMVLQGDKPEDTIRLTSAAHNIFVPKSSAGLMATVQGELHVKTIEKALAEHYESERTLAPGEKHKVITGDVHEVGLSMVALEMRPAS
jgi:hypothetical protein